MSCADVTQVLRQLPKFEHPNLLVGVETMDDAGVFRISPETALVQTVDVITPVVDDPYDYGSIAAANALSDIYAMGGKPLTAMNIIGFPINKLDESVLLKILQGGAEKLKEAGVVLVGGHSIKDQEVKYGLTVTGLIHPERIITNAKAKPGDRLILTKPLGIGIITTANRMEAIPQDLMKRITHSMATLNQKASEIMLKIGVNACTDVTGFGLFGHACEMAQMSQVTLTISVSKVPWFKEAEEYVAKGCLPGGSISNKEYFGPSVKTEPRIPQELQDICFDAQTSGGLLMAVDNKKANAMLKELHNQGVKDAAIIGEVITKQEKSILLSK